MRDQWKKVENNFLESRDGWLDSSIISKQSENLLLELTVRVAIVSNF